MSVHRDPLKGRTCGFCQTASAFAWEDTRERLAGKYKAFAMLNDKEKPVPDRVSKALLNFGIRPLKYSAPDEAIARLHAS